MASRIVPSSQHPGRPAAEPAAAGPGDDGRVTGGATGEAGPVVLTREGATLSVDPMAGGRIASLIVDGTEILVTDADGPFWWGCYPMAPFAGRIRGGRFRFRRRSYQLPLTMPPNAIHGTVLDRAWQVTYLTEDRLELETDLGSDWPFRGRATQTIGLVPGGLEATLTVEAIDPMPVVLGWHPWFRREIDGVAAQLDFEARWMYARDAAGLPTGATIAPTPRPWDDAFTDLADPASTDMAGDPPARHPLDGAVLGRLRRARRRDLRGAADGAARRVQPRGRGRGRSADGGSRSSGDDRHGVALGAARASAACRGAPRRDAHACRPAARALAEPSPSPKRAPAAKRATPSKPPRTRRARSHR